MNRRILRNLMVLTCAFSVSSCCGFVGAMNNIAVQHNTDIQSENVSYLMNLLFDEHFPYESSQRLVKAYSVFKDMSLDEKRNFIFQVAQHSDVTLAVRTELENFTGIHPANFAGTDSHEIISCDLGCCKQCLFQRNGTGSANFILSDVRQNDKCNGKIVCEITNNFPNGACIVLKPEGGDSYWLIRIQ